MIMKNQFDYMSPTRGRRVPARALPSRSPTATEVSGSGWCAVKFGGQSPAKPLRYRAKRGTASGGLASWSDEAGFVSQHDGLDTVAEAELGQYPPDVDLDCAF
jgi:hypothetical protein